MEEKRIETFLLAAENSVGHKQRRIFKKKRAGEVLTREQVAAIKMGRKLLKAELKAKGLKEKSDFELMASSMGLYFDKGRWLLWLRWLLHGRGLWALAGAAGLLLLTVLGFSMITQLQGHFTINMSSGMFREGFVLSETADFAAPVTHLFCTPAQDVPCISISHIPENIDQIDGQHNDNYFAYTFYIRNEGESTVGYDWTIRLNSESQNLSSACWVMVFEDGKMAFYAKAGADGQPQALPPMDDDTRGYLDLYLRQYALYPDEQLPIIAEEPGHAYYRAVPIPFETDTLVARGTQEAVAPMDVHKYTVVIWLEGDDPDCTDALIGGHAGMDFDFRLLSEDDGTSGSETGQRIHWSDLWDSLIWWIED